MSGRAKLGKPRLWVVQYSVNGGPWSLSIHDHRWYRVAETRAEAWVMAAQARAFAGPGWRYRVVAYEARNR